MNAETKNLTRIAGAAGGTGVAVGTDQDWLQIVGILIAALSTILPLIQTMFAKKRSGNSSNGSGALLLLLGFSVLLAGAGTGCRSLAPGGAYDGDQILFQADTTIATSYDLLHSFVRWEYEHRAALADKPEIKRAADHVRVNARGWITSALALRDAYQAAPTGANRDALQTSLSVLRAALNEATKYLAENQKQ